MGDRHLMIRDRALILRVLVPGLETRLRDKVGIEIPYFEVDGHFFSRRRSQLHMF